MESVIDQALSVQGETTFIEFKESFDTKSNPEWVEIVKDMVAIANSGGGVIVFGLDNNGTPVGADTSEIRNLDPADVVNRVYKYTGQQFADFHIEACAKQGHELAAIVLKGVALPLAFEKPGTYDIGGGKQKTAFGVGTVYFRHGAKSEPGNTEDLRKAFERRLDDVKDWLLQNVAQVFSAPLGSTLVTVQPGMNQLSLPVHITNDPNAPTVAGLTMDETHPFRQKELMEKINEALPENAKINQYDMQCVRRIYESNSNPTFHYLSKFGGHQYTLAYAEWIIEQYANDPDFFKKARQEVYNRRKSAALDESQTD